MTTKSTKSDAALAQEMILLGTFEDYDIEDVIRVLKAADDAYFNTAGDTLMEDKEYDALYRYAQIAAPHHSYFTGIGTESRGGKVKLPYQMGSLDQIQIGEIVPWVFTNKLGEEDILITDKLDGTSAMVIYDANGHLQIAYSRGNGIEGADITRHLKHIVPATADPHMVVRGEVIFTKDNFEIAKTKVKTTGGTIYKNARNMVAGLMNAETNDTIVYQYIHFVAYDVLGRDDLSKMYMLEFLDQNGFLTPDCTLTKGNILSDDGLAAYLTERRKHTEYEIDGIVLDADSVDVRTRLNPTRDTLNPAYSIKYKVADASNQAVATVKKVEWRPSKHGFLKPRVHIHPVELVGVTVQHATGFNALFIESNGIGPGAKINITRSGDVIPFITGVVESVAPQMPDKKWVWNDTMVDAVLDEHDEQVDIERITDFFAAIDAPKLKKGNVTKLFEAGHKTIVEIIKLSEQRMIYVLGEIGRDVYAGLKDRLMSGNMQYYVLLGAYAPARGIGRRKMKKLQQALGIVSLHACVAPRLIARQDGFDDVSAAKVIHCLEEFRTFWNDITGYVRLAPEKDVSNGVLAGQKVVFTGFRNKALQSQVEDEGGEMQSAVSGRTTLVVASNPNSTSGKMKKAKDLGIRVIGVEELEEMLQ